MLPSSPPQWLPADVAMNGDGGGLEVRKDNGLPSSTGGSEEDGVKAAARGVVAMTGELFFVIVGRGVVADPRRSGIVSLHGTRACDAGRRRGVSFHGARLVMLGKAAPFLIVMSS